MDYRPSTMDQNMKTFALALLAAVGGYAVGTFVAMMLIERYSSNQFDRSLEAAMTSALVVGPLTGLMAAGLMVAYRTSRTRVLAAEGDPAAGTE
jgi:ABC-type Fe3+ transport system permease subunit